MSSREAAKEYSPWRKPWVGAKMNPSPGGRKKRCLVIPNINETNPTQSQMYFGSHTHRVCFLSSLWGLLRLAFADPRLPPWAAFFRRSRGFPSLATHRRDLRGAGMHQIGKLLRPVAKCLLRDWPTFGINNSPRAFVWLAGRFSATLVRVRHLRFRGMRSLNRPGHGA